VHTDYWDGTLFPGTTHWAKTSDLSTGVPVMDQHPGRNGMERQM